MLIVTYCCCCYSLDSATLFLTVDLTKLQINVKTEMTLIFAKFSSRGFLAYRVRWFVESTVQ